LAVVHGLQAFSQYLTADQLLVQISVGCLLVVIGSLGVIRKPQAVTKPQTATLMRGFVSTFTVVVSNPVTLVTLAAVLAALGVVQVELDVSVSLSLAAAVFLGAMTLWIFLAQALLGLRRLCGERVCQRLTQGLSLVLLLLGFVYLTLALRPHD
jgi:hypothetical protein